MNEESLIQLSKHLANRIDCIQGAGGNSSVKLTDGTMLIKASGKLLKEVETLNAYTKIDVQKINAVLKDADFDVKEIADIKKLGEIVKAAKVNENDLQASMETSFHCLYGNAVLHTHDVYANIFLCSSHYHLLETCFNGEEDYTISLLNDYYTPGSELSWYIYDAYRFQPAMPNVTFLPNHGVIFSHEDTEKLLAMADEVQKRITQKLNLEIRNYPTFKIDTKESKNYIACSFLFEVWKTIAWETITTDLLFPDQAIYIQEDTISDKDQTAKLFINFAQQQIIATCTAREAEGILEIMIAYFFILSEIKKREYEPLTINAEFDKLRNMSSEQYRKQQLQ